MLLLLSWIFSLLLAIATFVAVGQLRQSAKAVTQDSTPSILAAQQIRTALVDMDASAANDLLAGPNGSRAAYDSFEADRSIIGRKLGAASENITYGNNERIPIETVSDTLGLYLQQITRARDLNRQGDAAGALTTFRQASALLRQTMLPAAEALDKVNADELDTAYFRHRSATVLSGLLIFGSGIALLLVLAGAQVFLLTRTRRIINLPLLVASVLLVVFLVRLDGVLSAESGHLKTANRDAFDSLSALARAESIATDANGDESLYLLDKQNAAQYDASYHDKITQTRQYLDAELRNITFPGEREAATSAQQRLQQYDQIDGQIRMLEQSGKHGEAVALKTGMRIGESNYTFGQFDTAVVQTMNINTAAFTQARDSAFAALNRVDVLAIGAALLLAFLAWLGLQPRLREYAV